VPDFMVIARTEAFIAGLGIEEAMKRANAYADSGADAILIHSKVKDADQVEGRAFRVNSRSPVTTHYMVLADTPDAVIYQTVQKKRDIAQRIQDIDERYAEKVRQNASTDNELAEAQAQHWDLVREQLIAETTVQHFWSEQQRLLATPRRMAQTWLQRIAQFPT